MTGYQRNAVREMSIALEFVHDDYACRRLDLGVLACPPRGTSGHFLHDARWTPPVLGVISA